MVKVTRLNLAYVVLAGIFGRMIVDPIYVNYELETVTTTLTVLGFATSLITGILIAVNLNEHFNDCLLRFIGWLKKDEIYLYKRTASKRQDFSETIDNFYGNVLLSFLTLIIALNYFCQSLDVSMGYFHFLSIPFINNNLSGLMGMALFIIGVIMVINSYYSFVNWRKRLDFYTYYEFYQTNPEYLTTQAYIYHPKKSDFSLESQKPFNDQKEWLAAYRKAIDSDWNKVADLFREKIYELEALVKGTQEDMTGFCNSFLKMRNLNDEERLRGLTIDQLEETKAINYYWNSLIKIPGQLDSMESGIYRLKINGLHIFIASKSRIRFLNFYKEVSQLCSQIESFDNNVKLLEKDDFDHNVKGDGTPNWLKKDWDRDFKRFMVLKHISIADNFRNEFLSTRKNEAEVFTNQFIPLVERSKLDDEKNAEPQLLTTIVNRTVTAYETLMTKIDEFCNKTESYETLLEKILSDLEKKRNKASATNKIEFFH